MAIQDADLCMNPTGEFVTKANLNISAGGEEVNVNATIGGGTVRLNVSVGSKEVHINVVIRGTPSTNIRMIVSLEGKPTQMKVTELPGSSILHGAGKDAKDKESLTYSSTGYDVTSARGETLESKK